MATFADPAHRSATLRGVMLCAVLVLALPPPAWTDVLPEFALLETFEEVSDEELASMRGRYISQGRLVYFGIVIQTQWLSPTGESITAGVTMDISFQKEVFNGDIVRFGRAVDVRRGGQPVGFVLQGPIARPAAAGGPNPASGVAQTITVTGHANSVRNDAQVMVRSRGREPSEFPTLVFDGVDDDRLVLEEGAVTMITGSGAVATAFVEENALGVRVIVPGQGEVVQAVQGGTGRSDPIGILQRAQISGTDNQVFNMIGLMAEFERLNSFSIPEGLEAALDSLRPLRGGALF